MPGPKFFRLARRLGAYEGAVVARHQMEEEEGKGRKRPAPRQEMSNYERRAYADIESAETGGEDYLSKKLREKGVA